MEDSRTKAACVKQLNSHRRCYSCTNMTMKQSDQSYRNLHPISIVFLSHGETIRSKFGRSVDHISFQQSFLVITSHHNSGWMLQFISAILQPQIYRQWPKNFAEANVRVVHDITPAWIPEAFPHNRKEFSSSGNFNTHWVHLVKQNLHVKLSGSTQ